MLEIFLAEMMASMELVDSRRKEEVGFVCSSQ